MAATTKAQVDASLGSVGVLRQIADNPAMREAVRVAASKAVIEFAYKSGLYAVLEHKISQLEGNSEDKSIVLLTSN
jgi:hypothetical protein